MCENKCHMNTENFYANAFCIETVERTFTVILLDNYLPLTVADPGFPEVGAPTLGREAPTYDFAPIFPETA